MTGPSGRAATAAAVAALTEYLAAAQAESPRTVGDYLQQLVDDDGIGSLAQGYFGLLDLAALLLPGAARDEGVSPQELLARIGLRTALDP